MEESTKVLKGGGGSPFHAMPVVKELPPPSPSFQVEDVISQDGDDLSDDGTIPTFADLKSRYDAKWLKEKEKFFAILKKNFRVLTDQFRTGKQELYQLAVTSHVNKYIQAFRELFADPGYQASVGEDEHSACGNKRTKKLFIYLPECVK